MGSPMLVTRVDHLPTCEGAPSSAIDRSGLLRMREASAFFPTSSKYFRERIELGSQSILWLSESPCMPMRVLI